MRLTTYLIMAFVGLLAVIGVLFFLLAGTEEPNENESSDTKEKEIKKEEKEIKKEEKIDNSLNNKDVFKDALKTRNLERCSNLTDEELEDECWDAVLLSNAINDTKDSYCRKIRDPDRKQYCFDQISLEYVKLYKDFTRCEDIVNKGLHARCQEIESRSKILQVTSMKDCATISTEKDKKLCNDFFTAKKIKQSKKPKSRDCIEFSKIEDQKQCLLRLAIKTAEKLFDTTPCINLKDSDLQKVCLKKVREKFQEKESNNFMNSGNVEGCDALVGEEVKSFCRDRALTVRASQDYSPFVCHEIKNQKQKDICIERSTNAANSYFYRKAKSEKDVKWCQLIPSEDAKKSCNTLISAVQ